MTWIQKIEKQSGLRVLAFQMENAKEFVGSIADVVFRRNGFVLQSLPS